MKPWFDPTPIQASISTDNHLRVYECLEQPSLATWQLSEEVDILNLASTSSPATVSLALATPTQTNATLEGASASLVAQAAQQAQTQQAPNTQIRPGLGNREADGGWCISWCKDRYWGEVIAAGCGISGTVKVKFLFVFSQAHVLMSSQIIQFSSSRRPTAILILNTSPTTYGEDNISPIAPGGLPTELEYTPVAYAITSVSWAPSCGRSYHLIATGSRDGHVRIWKVKPGEDEGDGNWTASVVADFDHHK